MPQAPFWRSPGETELPGAARCVPAASLMWRHRTVRMAAKAAGGVVLVPCVGLTVTA